jgi:hypothetical protein
LRTSTTYLERRRDETAEKKTQSLSSWRWSELRM